MTSFTREIIVRFEHCDPAGLMFYPRFFALVNEMVEDWFAGPLACSFKALHVDQGKGVPTVKLDAAFLRPARIGATLRQDLKVAHLGGASCRLRHEASIAGEIVATFDHTIVYIDLNSMNPEPWPTELRAAMSLYAENDS
jgi:4-hydroxybenzoyl-CoA thioesterase